MAEQTRLGAISIMRQRSNGGYASNRTGFPRTFEATGAGSATTIVSTTLGAFTSANSDLPGMLIEPVRCANGPSSEGGAPLRRKIMAYNDSTSTLYIEALPFATAENDSFKLVDDPGCVFCEDTGGSQTAIIDDTVSMTASSIIGNAAMGGPYMVALSTGSITTGTQRLITAYEASTATVASYGASTVVGDLYEAYQWLEVFGDGMMNLGRSRVARESMTGTFGKLRGVAGISAPTGSIELAWRGPGSSRISSAAESDVILGSCMTLTAAVSAEAAGAGCTTSSINVGSAGTAGEMWLAESGDVFVDSDGADPLTPSPTLRTAPAQGEVLYSMRKFTPAEAAQYFLKVVQYRGRGWKDEIVGVLPKLKWSFAKGEFFKLQVDLVGADGYSVYLDSAGAAISRPTLLDPKLSTVTPKARDDIRVNIDGVEFEARAGSGDMGFMVEPETNLVAPNQQTTSFRGDAPTGQLELYLDSDAKLLAVKSFEGKPMRALIQVGVGAGFPGVWAFWMNEIEVTSVEHGDDSGLQTATIQYSVTYNPASTLDRWIMGYC